MNRSQRKSVDTSAVETGCNQLVNPGKPPLVVLLGAGSSQALGLPGTCGISDVVAGVLRERNGLPLMQGLQVLDDAMRSEIPVAKRPFIDLIRKASAAETGVANFETDLNVLESLMALAPITTVDQYVNPTSRSAIAGMIVLKARLEGLASRTVLGRLMDVLITTVIDEVAKRELAIEPGLAESFSQVLLHLADRFELRLYTLNYDRSLERAIRGPNDGFEPSGQLDRFSTRRFLGGRGTRLAHLHGATNFRVSRTTDDGEREFAVVKLRDGVDYHGRGLQSYAEATAQAGDHLVIGSIITGLRKAEKTRYQPYGTYSWSFESDLLESGRILLIGYGGGDLHINHQLMHAAEYWGAKLAAVSVVLEKNTTKVAIWDLVAWLGGLHNDLPVQNALRCIAPNVPGLQQIGSAHVDTAGLRLCDPGQIRDIVAALS